MMEADMDGKDNDFLSGGWGNDILNGEGDDQLFGGEGNENLLGDAVRVLRSTAEDGKNSVVITIEVAAAVEAAKQTQTGATQGQMAMLIASGKTVAKAAIPGLVNAVFGKSDATPALTNQYDVVGRETTTKQTALVADSQWHYGSNVDVFIEDQPLPQNQMWRQAA